MERRFKFAWSRTWPEREQDFVAADGELQIGRVSTGSSVLMNAGSGP